MFKRLYPTQYITSIFDLNMNELKEKGKKGIIFDIDNTLVPYDVIEPTQEIIELFTSLQKNGFKITLVSNNTQDRVLKFNEKLKVFALHKSRKPGTRSFKKALEFMKLEREAAVIVGDQIFTDIYGGNKAGIETILVQPVSEKDEWITKIKRGLEKKVIRSYEKYRNNRSN